MPSTSSRYVFLLMIISFQVAYGQPEEKLVRKIDSIFSKWDRTNSPGCALAIVKDGKIIYERGYGMANLEYNIAITPASRFHVASISKQFTAASIQRLALEGRLSLKDDIRKYLPEMPEFGHTITIANLIHHTSGLRDQWDLQRLAGWRDDDVVTENDILEMAKRQQALNFIPGEEYSYCNTGYTLLGIIVKRVTAVSLRKYADSVFFKPLGMNNTVFHSDHSEIVVNRTSAYELTDEQPVGGPSTSGQRWAISIPVFDNYGATSLFTTVEDLAKWDENFYTHQVGGEDFIKAMVEPGVFNNGQVQTYASGLSVGEYFGNKTVEHSGADAGYRANILRFPDRHLSVIVLANLANINPGDLCRRVARLFLPPWSGGVQTVHVVDSSVVKGWAGDYLDQVTKLWTTISAEPVKGFPTAVLKVNGTELTPGSDSVYTNSGGGRYTFSHFGAQPRFRLQSAGMRDRVYQKVSKVVLSPAALGVYAGEYYSKDLDVDFVVSVKDSGLVVKPPRIEPVDLSPFSRDIFTGPFLMEFVRDRKGVVTGFLLSTGRSRGLVFSKTLEK